MLDTSAFLVYSVINGSEGHEKMPDNTPKGDRKRTNIRLPITLIKAIKIEAAQTERVMSDIIVEQLTRRYEGSSLFLNGGVSITPQENASTK